MARAVVKWGFFVMYFVLGAVVSLLLQSDPNVGVTVTAGLAFAWTVMAIRSKLWKLIGAAAIIAAMPFFAPLGKAIGKWTEGQPVSGTKGEKPRPDRRNSPGS